MPEQRDHRLIRIGKACFLLLSGWTLFPSCDEAIEWELDYQEMNAPVIEARITSELTAHEIRISKPYYEMNGVAEGISGARVMIYDGTHEFPFSELADRPGYYRSDTVFAAKLNQYYLLGIELRNKQISALTQMREVMPFRDQDMRIYKVQDDPLLYGLTIRDSDRPSIVRIELDWSGVSGYENEPDSATHAIIYHYTINGIDVNKMFKPAQERVYFPPGTLVYREKESVNQVYGAYLRGILSETDWRGGMFDVLPGNATSNLRGGALGFFTAADILRDSMEIP